MSREQGPNSCVNPLGALRSFLFKKKVKNPIFKIYNLIMGLKENIF